MRLWGVVYLALGGLTLLALCLVAGLKTLLKAAKHRPADGVRAAGRRRWRWWPDKPTDCLVPFWVLALWPIIAGMLVSWWFATLWRSVRGRHAATEKVFAPTREALVRPVTLDEVAQRERVHDPLGAVPDLPFGHLHGAWQRFIRDLGPEDELWRFSMAAEAPQDPGAILEGYVIVRNGDMGPHFVASRKRS